MELDLTDKVTIVTGAGRGIGLAICEVFVAEGATVVANTRSQSSALDALKDRGLAAVVLGDMLDPGTPDALVAAAGGRVDVLVNNAGIAPARPDGFLQISDEDWQHTFALNLFAAIRMTRAVLPAMLSERAGAVVNIGSLNARLADPMVLDYSAAKSALASVTKSLSKAYGHSGIRFNSVDPGPVDTDLWNGEHGVAHTLSQAGAGQPHEVTAQAAAAMATGRFSTPAEVATLVATLASPRFANVTGASFVIDGGMMPAL